MRWITWMFGCFLEEKPDPIVGGKRFICIVVIGYVFMHVISFHVPHFTWSTPEGRNEIVSAGGTLLLAGMGAILILIGVIRRRRASGHKTS